MRTGLNDSRRSFLTGLLLLPLAGCGSGAPSGREDIAKIPPEEHYGSSVKNLLYEFRAKVRKRGVPAAKKEIPIVLENIQGYEQQPLGQNLETMKKIEQLLKDTEKKLSGSITKEEVVDVANTVADLASKLPGKANENPRVE
jgi:hypothetical protein